MDVGPWRRLDGDLQCFCRLASRCKVCGLQWMRRPIRSGTEAGHDLEREVPRRGELVSRRHRSQRCPRGDTSRTRIGDRVDDQRRVEE